MKEVSAWIASHSFTYVIAAAVLAFLVPEVNPQSWTQPLLFICEEEH